LNIAVNKTERLYTDIVHFAVAILLNVP